MATRSGTPARTRLRTAVRRKSCGIRPEQPERQYDQPRHTLPPRNSRRGETGGSRTLAGGGADDSDRRQEPVASSRHRQPPAQRKIRQSCRTTLKSELLIFSGCSPLYSMKPSFLNLFRKKFTRERVVPII